MSSSHRRRSRHSNKTQTDRWNEGKQHGTIISLTASDGNVFSADKAGVAWSSGGVPSAKAATLDCPVQLHFGELDHGISLEGVEDVRLAHPEVELFVYASASHGFGCDQRGSHNQAAYQTAQARCLAFLNRHLR